MAGSRIDSKREVAVSSRIGHMRTRPPDGPSVLRRAKKAVALLTDEPPAAPDAVAAFQQLCVQATLRYCFRRGLLDREDQKDLVNEVAADLLAYLRATTVQRSPTEFLTELERAANSRTQQSARRRRRSRQLFGELSPAAADTAASSPDVTETIGRQEAKNEFQSCWAQLLAELARTHPQYAATIDQAVRFGIAPRSSKSLQRAIHALRNNVITPILNSQSSGALSNHARMVQLVANALDSLSAPRAVSILRELFLRREP